MEKSQVERLLNEYFEGKGELVETHVSLLILTENEAFKFKKNLKFPFLDFSSLEQRKFYCQKELNLNRRLAPDVYLEVVSISEHEGKLQPGPLETPHPIGYGIRMKRLDNDLEMDKLLLENKVSSRDITEIAKVLADFHQRIEKVFPEITSELLKEEFNDLNTVAAFIREELGDRYAERLQQFIRFSDQFIEAHFDLWQQRIRSGYFRNCHGDLHSRNIFLYHPPVLFDCIEFNEEFRQIDLLNEIAFFCMDLEAFGFELLTEQFLDDYLKHMNSDPGLYHKELFIYFKAYRANVRAKVTALKAAQAESGQEKAKELPQIRKYLDMIGDYFAEIGMQ